MAYTEGPWQRNGSHIYGSDPERTLIAQVLGPDKNSFLDNASLIVAAPALLEACKIALAESVGQPSRRISTEGLDILRAAITKAETA